MKVVPCWHSHHEMCSPVGWVDFEGRRKQILETKPQQEHAIRLKLFKPVKGALPEQLTKVWLAYNKAGRACLTEIMALHAKECGCPWTPENRNILKFAQEGASAAGRLDDKRVKREPKE